MKTFFMQPVSILTLNMIIKYYDTMWSTGVNLNEGISHEYLPQYLLQLSITMTKVVSENGTAQ